MVFLDPIVADINEARRVTCTGPRDFVYAEHPNTLLPLFAELDQTEEDTNAMRCFYAAKYDMLLMRASFDPLYSDRNETLIELVAGTHATCSDKPGMAAASGEVPCPSYKLSIVQDALKEDDFAGSRFCQDEEIMLTVFRLTCLNDYFTNTFPGLSHLSDTLTCAEVYANGLCTCSGHECEPTDDYTMPDGLMWNYNLADALRRIARRAAARATNTSNTNGAGSSTNGTSSGANGTSNGPPQQPSDGGR
eukprot:CAMPEP_0115192074 /NCGR_PEP_ID=MMETSP0270-20121206/12855_1 /TAXON_ID=71861 /ORGANISM="Scrippsiella trochoidea, Strain CCMP3099" /LENGTH=248 /DNA_ID=CAMNT_0002605309 /DNA_START=41 /DNA_END=788 /DNA_ORIENTATION=-